MEEEQDYEKPLKELEGEESGMDERLEEMEKDVSERRTEWEGKQGDSAVPGAQDSELLKEDYGAGEEEDEEVEGEDSGHEGEEEDDEDHEDHEDDEASESESRGEGAAEEE